MKDEEITAIAKAVADEIERRQVMKINAAIPALRAVAKIPNTHETYADWYRLYTAENKSFAEIASLYGVTRQAVDLAMRKYFGYVKKRADGGFKAAAKRAQQERRFKRIVKPVGLPIGEFERITGVRYFANVKEVTRYVQMRNNAKRYGIEFNLTWTQWWHLWQESGHWDGRGIGAGYCMARIDTSKPIELGNVRIEDGITRASRNTFGRVELRA